MHWLNNFLAVPAVGLRLLPNFQLVGVLDLRFATFLESIKDEFGTDSLEISTKNRWENTVVAKEHGFQFSFSLTDIVAQYSYPITKKDRPGGLPSFTVPELRSYSEILDILQKHLAQMIDLIAGVPNIQYHRIGIIADAQIAEESLPPGLAHWISHMSKPWELPCRTMDCHILARLKNETSYFDQCHHEVKVGDKKEEIGIHFKLDWQRVLSEAKRLSSFENKAIQDCVEEALLYFQKFGEGDLNYEF